MLQSTVNLSSSELKYNAIVLTVRQDPAHEERQDWVCNRCWQTGEVQSTSRWPPTALLREEFSCEEELINFDTSRHVARGYEDACREKGCTLRESVQQKTAEMRS